VSHERKVIAAQVVASAVALLIVYLTLLTPDNDGPLFGVQAPGDGAGLERQHARADQKPDRRRGKGDRGPGTISAPVFVPAPLLPTGVTPESDVTPVSDGPEFDQYTDSLGQIRARVAAG
jgi:hypothetical protein